MLSLLDLLLELMETATKGQKGGQFQLRDTADFDRSNDCGTFVIVAMELVLLGD